MFDKILIATDNSPLIRSGMEYTSNLFPDAEYHLVNVLNTKDKSVPKTNLIESRMKKEAEEAIFQSKKILKDMGVERIKTAMPIGDPSEEILDYINKNQIDLLVIGTHSKSGAQEIHIGDTSSDILKVVSIPSLIIARRFDPMIPKTIFNPTTFSSYSVDATMIALDLAEMFDASLTTYHIGKKDPGAASRRIKRVAKKADIDFELIVNKGATEEEILDESAKYDFMVGSRGRGSFLYKLRFLFPKFAFSKIERILIAESEVPYIMSGD